MYIHVLLDTYALCKDCATFGVACIKKDGNKGLSLFCDLKKQFFLMFQLHYKRHISVLIISIPYSMQSCYYVLRQIDRNIRENNPPKLPST